jgi:DNA polymerase-3 subunit epsilon
LEHDRCLVAFLKTREAPFAALDFESAGTAPGLTDEPVQIAVVHWHGASPRVALNSHLRPSRPVTWAARQVHGISDAQLENAPRLVDLWPAVKASLGGRWIVAHGAATEKRFLRVFPFHGFGPWVDTLLLARAVYPSLASHALGDVVSALGLADSLKTPDFRWHDAASDASATLVLLHHLIDAADIHDEPAEILTRPNLEAYFKARRATRRPV